MPSPVTQGSTFTAEARHGYVFARPIGGGKGIRLPGHLASTDGWPVARGNLVTYAVRDHGWTRIRVVRATTTGG